MNAAVSSVCPSFTDHINVSSLLQQAENSLTVLGQKVHCSTSQKHGYAFDVMLLDVAFYLYVDFIVLVSLLVLSFFLQVIHTWLDDRHSEHQ